MTAQTSTLIVYLRPLGCCRSRVVWWLPRGVVVNGEVVVNEWCVVVFVNLSSSSSWLLSTREVLTLVCGWWWLSSTCGVVEGKTGGLTRHHHHASIVRTDHVTDPSPARTGTGTSRVIFFSPVPVPVTPVPAIPHGFLFPCPSLPEGDQSYLCPLVKCWSVTSVHSTIVYSKWEV